MRFQVLRRVDSYVDYVASVEADSAEEAAQLASEAEDEYNWEAWGPSEFDARTFVALEEDGTEIESTRCGDF